MKQFFSFPLKLYDSSLQDLRVFSPENPEKIKFYVCGPTVYDRIHVGNARTFLVFDMVYRLLLWLYPDVCYVRNITDIDDKIYEKAALNHQDIESVSQENNLLFQQDIQDFGLLEPSAQPKATQFIPEMITMIQNLLDKGHAYVQQGHVLFSIESYEAYGSLAGLSPENMLAGARIDPSPYKKNPLDFVLWKPALPDQKSWSSPWGQGRVGWHIECSAMSRHYLGNVMDLHGGGGDLKFPHHENEQAQSCAISGEPFLARHWMHVNLLRLEGQKMSKSLGNSMTLRQALNHHGPLALRWILLSSHYRHPLSWTSALHKEASRLMDRWQNWISKLSAHWPESMNFRTALDHLKHRYSPQQHCEKEILFPFFQALLDDLNIPLALRHLHALLKQYAQKETPTSHEALDIQAALCWMGFHFPSDSWKKTPENLFSAEKLSWIQDIIEKRQKARDVKDYLQADQWRKVLENEGILLLDGPEGTRWIVQS